MSVALQVVRLSHRYGAHQALDDISFDVPDGCLFGVLGPNGSGKTTLFRLLATLLPLQQGRVQVCGHDLQTQPAEIRRRLGITFQSPALDSRLSVVENLQCHGRIHGMRGSDLRQRIDQLLTDLNLADRRRSLVSELSGGLRRRVELAKGLLHRPALLLLDEPSTGLDPAARRQFWQLIDQQRSGMTIIVTTHLMEEAAGCEQLLLLDKGRIVAQGSPSDLQSSLAGERLTIRTSSNVERRTQLEGLLQCEGRLVGDRLCFRLKDASAALQRVMLELGQDVLSAEVTRPTLEDVFLEKTGRDLSQNNVDEKVA